MDAIMRKVKFRLLAQIGYTPGKNEAEVRESEELTKERCGYLHAYTQDVDTSKDLPFVRTLALVEDATDGRIHIVDPSLMSFVEQYEHKK